MSQVLFTSEDLLSYESSVIQTPEDPEKDAHKGWIDTCLRPILFKSGLNDSQWLAPLKVEVQEDFYFNVADSAVLRKAFVYCLKKCASMTVSDESTDRFIQASKDFFHYKYNINDFKIGKKLIKEKIEKRIKDMIEKIKYEDRVNCGSLQMRRQAIIRGLAKHWSGSRFVFVVTIVKQLVREVLDIFTRLETLSMDIWRINETENLCYLLITLRSVLVDVMDGIECYDRKALSDLCLETNEIVDAFEVNALQLAIVGSLPLYQMLSLKQLATSLHFKCDALKGF